MPITYRSQGFPLSFTQLDENFRTLHRNARVWDDTVQYEIGDFIFYDGSFYEAIDETTVGVFPSIDTGWDLLIIDGESVSFSGRTINAGSGLTGGGNLGQDITISHADTSSSSGFTTSNNGGTVIKNVSVELDTFGHVINSSVSSINLDSRYISNSGGTINGNLILNGSLSITSTGLVTNLNADKLDGYHAQDIIDATKPEYYVRFAKADIPWDEEWIQIQTILYPYMQNDVKNVTFKARFGYGTVVLDPIIHYPPATVNYGIPFRGFYIKDANNLISKSADFEYIEVYYDIEYNSLIGFRYDSTYMVLGENVVDTEGDYGLEHSRLLHLVYTAVYPEFETTLGHTYYETVLDPLANTFISNSFQARYCSIRGANLIMRPYENGAIDAQYISTPNILEVGAHYGNTDPITGKGMRHDITSGPTVFLSNTVAIGARVNDATTIVGMTSYGFGMEFFEETSNINLNAEYPDYRGEAWVCNASADATGYIVTGTPRVFNSVTYYPKFDQRLDMDPGKPIKIGSELRYIDTILNENQLTVTEPFDTREVTDIFYIADAGIGTILVSNKYANNCYQSPATTIIGAKLKKIKLGANVNWQIVREAARATAYLANNTATLRVSIDPGYVTQIFTEEDLSYFPQEDPGMPYRTMGIVQVGNNYFEFYATADRSIIMNSTYATYVPAGAPITLIWDVYRGFGKIDVDAAIAWIKSEYSDNFTYLNLLADSLEGTHGINSMLQLGDLRPNSPVSKKMVEDNYVNITGDTMTGALYGTTFDGDGVAVDYIKYKIDSTATLTPGVRRYNDAVGTTELRLKGDNVTLQDGQEIVIYCYNNSGVDIHNGDAVTIVGGNGDYDYIELAIGTDGDNTKYRVNGVATEDIPNGAYGFITYLGKVHDLDLSYFAHNDEVYLSQTQAGKLVKLDDLDIHGRVTQIGKVIQNGVDGILRLNIMNEPAVSSNTLLELNVLNANNTSTGVYAFGGISLDDTSHFSVGDVKGWVVDNTTDPIHPVITYVDYQGQSGLTTPYLNSANITYILLNVGGTLDLQSTYPTPTQRRQSIFLGNVGHPDKATLTTALNITDHILSPTNQLRDMFACIPLINDGIYVYPNGANLALNNSDGFIYGMGINFSDNSLDPNRRHIDSGSAIPFKYRTRSGGSAINVNLIDPTVYDDNGILTPIGSPAKQATNQRIYLLQNGEFRVQYGQTVYPDLATAIANVSTETFVTFPGFKTDGILIGVLSVSSNAINLSDITYAKILGASKFGEAGSAVGGSGGAVTLTLQIAYDNGNTIITNQINDGVIIRRGSNADTDKLLKFQNGDTNEVASIDAQGNAVFTTMALGSNAIFDAQLGNVFSGITATVAFVDATNITAAFFDYVAINGSNVICGTVITAHDGAGNTTYTDYSTPGLGNVSTISFSTVVVNGLLQLKATTTANWTIKTTIRTL